MLKAIVFKAALELNGSTEDDSNPNPTQQSWNPTTSRLHWNSSKVFMDLVRRTLVTLSTVRFLASLDFKPWLARTYPSCIIHLDGLL